MKPVLLLDNYDSFTYNLEHLLIGLGVEVVTVRNDDSIGSIEDYSHIVLSPGPGLPRHAGNMMSILQLAHSQQIPILGVCLGMQAIAEYLGGHLYNQNSVKHGVSELIELENVPLFNELESQIEVGLYHSWAIHEEGDFEVIARSKSKVIMALQNTGFNMYGVQFHPESIMTPKGNKIVENFIRMRKF